MKKEYIIKSSRDITSILSKGKKLRTPISMISYIKGSEFKIGISVPKKTGNAVYRNKTKRQIKNIIDSLQIYDLNKHIVLIAKDNWKKNNFEQNKTILENEFKKIK